MIDFCLSCILLFVGGTAFGYYFIGPVALIIAALIVGYLTYKKIHRGIRN